MDKANVPESMTAVVLDQYAGIEALRVEERPVPKPGKNQILVKVAASPINPSDLTFIQGQYGFRKPLPAVPGMEGSGTVVAAGSGLMARYLNGKRVACVAQSKGDGIWAEYVLVNSSLALPLDSSVSLEQGAMSVVNPLTAIALLTIAKQDGHRAIVNTAAASALGQMISRLGPTEGIQVINVVRRAAQADLLTQQGATVVLDSSDPNFLQELRGLCEQHDARQAFDAVAGPLATQLLDAMPPHSRLTIYGGMSMEPAQVTASQVIFQDKRVDGFWLSSWMAGHSFLHGLRLWRRAQKLLPTVLKTEIRARYPLLKVRDAVEDYQNHLTGGKVLLVPELNLQ